MAYRYEKTDTERYAEKLLRDKGWTVSEPKCPLCHGMGSIGWSEAKPGLASWGVKPCPNGCPTPAMYFPATI